MTALILVAVFACAFCAFGALWCLLLATDSWGR